MNLEVILAALHKAPSDHLGWLAVADCLEEMGETERAELARCSALARQPGPEERQALDGRVRQLLGAGVPPCVPTRTGGAGMTFALIPPGTFWMGSPQGEEGRALNEGPRHEVEITRAFYAGLFPVTVGQFRAFISASGYRTEAERRGGASCWTGVARAADSNTSWRNPGWEQADEYPVTCVTWNDAMAFCEWLTEQQPGFACRLPTEAQWEYCCRGGLSSYSVFHFGNSIGAGNANFRATTPYGGAAVGPWTQRPSPVGSYPANAFGLHDLHGNLWEWCHDWFAGDYYANSPRADPTGPENGERRMVRGGSWLNEGQYCRAASRGSDDPGCRDNISGFRVVLVPVG